jgi:hypothetical protein
MLFQQLGPELKESETYWFFEKTFNGYVNFCVWVLQVDGLSVPPFNSHLDGDSVLRKRGLDAESWHTWLARVVATQDSRLYGHVSDIEVQVAKDVSDSKEQINQLIEQGVIVPELNWSMISESTRRRLIWQEEQYQRARKQLGDFSRDATPPDVWDGDPGVGETLKQLWERYRLMNNRSNRGIAKAMETNDLSLLDFQQYQKRLDTLKIYLVDYPEAVEYLIPPISILVSLTDELYDNQEFRLRTINAVEHLSILTT